MQQIRPSECAFGPYTIRTDEHVLRFRGAPIALAPKVVATLQPFFEEPGRVISKAELMERIWPDAFVEEANLTQNIYVLRKLFDEHQSGVRIENVPKRGYRLITLVRLVPATTPARATGQPLGLAARLGLGMLALAIGLLAFASQRLPARQSAVSSPYQLNAPALRQYLLGTYELSRGTDANARASIVHFAELVDQVPASALGYAGLAEGYTSRTFFTADPLAQANFRSRAVTLARTAVRIEPNSAEAHASLGAVESVLEHNELAAAREFDESLRLDPDNANALAWYGTMLMNQGRAAEARTMFAHGLSIDPSVPGLVASLAWADFLLRNYAEAAAFSKQLLRAHRLERVAQVTLASSDVAIGDDAAAQPIIRALDLQPGMHVQAAALASQIDTMRGRPSVALEALKRLELTANFERIGSWDILAVAAAYARLGREDAAFVWLDRVQAAERPQLARDPRFDRLRADPRFAAWLSV